MTRPALQAGLAQSLEKGILTVGYPPAQEGQRVIVDQERTRTSIETKLAEWGCPATVRFVRLPGPPAAEAPEARTVIGTLSGPGVHAEAADVEPRQPATKRARARAEKVTPARLDPAAFKDDPLIKQALELFKGQIVEIRPPIATDDPEPTF